MKKSTEQQILALFTQALRTAVALLEERGVESAKLPTGIYPHRSKYNPFRAYVWNGEKQVYIGASPTVSAAKRAQRDYRAGKQPATGTRVANHRTPLAVIQRAA
jgi:hypothetical protein